mmetsp:Transcript_66349/g.144018  ORF Transcript_66349/g.144018 Transcript_66349/m.144018 type:complete len:161 (+) Transcript_66349:286-768(+)
MGAQASACCTRCEDACPDSSAADVIVAKRIMVEPQQASGSPTSQASSTSSHSTKRQQVDLASGKKQLSRFDTFQVYLKKHDTAPLGIDVNYADKRTLLVVSINVKEGMVLEWNKENPDAQIWVGDRILSVNGVTEDTAQMIEACKDAETIDLLVLRSGGP